MEPQQALPSLQGGVRPAHRRDPAAPLTASDPLPTAGPEADASSGTAPSERLRSRIGALLHRAGLPAAPLELTPAQGGANNRTFHIRAAGMRLFAKCYFRHPSDPRDRLGAELRFLTFARAEGICNVPEPVAADPDQGIALFRQIEGRRLRPEEIGADHVRAAAVFVDRLNRAREAGGDLPRASDAFFRIAEQCTHLEGRIETLRWETARRDGPLQREAAELVGRIATAWHRIRGEIVRIVDPAAELPTTQRCISPSDFGFHNALLTDGGELCFLDFEYAGWDDPAKLCCDFFCQPDLPVPLRYSGLFIEEALKSFAPAADMLAMRAAALFPLFSLKWCCIMLNPFLPGGARRRRFADGGAESERRLRRQLDRAAEALDRMEDGRLGLR